MNLKPAIDLDELREAIGRETTAYDEVTPQKCHALAATLDKEVEPPRAGQEAPPAIHWCLAPDIVPMAEIGPDGHAQRGGFLPTVSLPRRMWAGGRLEFHDRIQVGDKVTIVSRIEDVSLKDGRTGPLCFVTVRREVSTSRGPAIWERQDIVYRGAESAVPAASRMGTGETIATPRDFELSRSLSADPVLLFRYSALTFNAHRIHYDRDYAMQVEGYPGLVVHGPLQASLMLSLAAERRGMPTSFEFRATSPLFDGAAFTVNAAARRAGLDLWVADASGRTTMTGGVLW